MAKELALIDEQRRTLLSRRRTLREYMRANLERDAQAMALIGPSLSSGNQTPFYPETGFQGNSTTNDLLRPYLERYRKEHTAGEISDSMDGPSL